MKVKLIKQIVGSTYLFHNDISFHNAGVTFRLSSTVKMFAKTGPRGEPMIHHEFEYGFYYQGLSVHF